MVLILALAPSIAGAQELEPGAYWPLPVGLNILTAVNSVNWGDLSFEPSVPVEAAQPGSTPPRRRSRERCRSPAARRTPASDPDRRRARRRVVPRAAGRDRPVRVRRSAVQAGGEPLRRAGDEAENFAAYKMRTIVGVSVGSRPRSGSTTTPRSSTSAPTAGRSSPNWDSRAPWGPGWWN